MEENVNNKHKSHMHFRGKMCVFKFTLNTTEPFHFSKTRSQPFFPVRNCANMAHRQHALLTTDSIMCLIIDYSIEN